MKPAIQEFDPEGDVVLVLDTDRLKFAWSDDTLTLGPDSKGKKRKLSCCESSIPLRTPAGPSAPASGGAFPNRVPASTERHLPDGAHEPAAIVPNDNGVEALHEDDALSGGVRQIRMQVSSRHLSLASPVFKKMLSGPWKENQEDSSGIRQISASGWDYEAMIIFLDIIHNHHRAVPRHLGLETVAKLAIIVDYYECHEPMEVFVEIWLAKLKTRLPKTYGKESMLWLFTSCIFPQPDILENMARLAVNNSTCVIRVIDVPIPIHIMDKINVMRCVSLSKVFSLLYNMMEKLSDETAPCTFECAAFLLGALMKGLKGHGALSPQITTPYGGYSVESATRMVQDFKSPNWVVETGNSGLKRHECTLQNRLGPSLDHIRRNVRKWKISEYDVGVNRK